MNSIAFRSVGLLALLICGFFVVGCSTFDHDWDAAAGVRPVSQSDISGRWQGTWSSNANSHSGDLRCLITRTDDKTFHARYAATYASILHFNYEMDLTAEREGEFMRFAGQADLGAMAGGIYHYEGHANATDFFANYKSDGDYGRFVMKRP